MFDNLSANQSGVARCFAASGESQVPLGRLLRWYATSPLRGCVLLCH